MQRDKGSFLVVLAGNKVAAGMLVVAPCERAWIEK